MTRHALKFLSAAVLLAFSAQAVSALTVTASPAPGTFKEKVSVTLTADAPGAKILYGFDPDGQLGDYKAYSSEVEISATTPLVWYGFLDERTESPISIEKYSVDYSGTFALAGARAQGGKIVGLGVRNAWSGALSSAGWTARSGNASVPLPARRFAPGEAAKIPDLSYSGGSLELVAPDGSVHASMTAAQLAAGIAYAPPSALAASLLDAGSSPAAWALLIVAALATAGLVRALLRVRRAHGGWRHAWRAAKAALRRGTAGLQKPVK